MHRSTFTVDELESNFKTLVIRDVGDWRSRLTITNDAERVVADLHRDGFLPLDRELLYYDSDGDLWELQHNGYGKFLGFAERKKVS